MGDESSPIISNDTPKKWNGLPTPATTTPRQFLRIVEPAGRKICNGTTILKCRAESIAANSKDCGTCRQDMKDLKETICKTWNCYNNDQSKKNSNQEKLMKRHSHLLVKFYGCCRIDRKEAIGLITVWKPKGDSMKALWFKEEEIDLELREEEMLLEEQPFQ